MEQEHIEQLNDMLRMYGTDVVVEAMVTNLETEAKKHSEGAIIHQNLPIVRFASDNLNACKMARFSHIIGA